MKRAVVFLSVAIFAAGCQSADPLAAFGPYKVPAPTTAPATPYYPATGAAAPVASAQTSTSQAPPAQAPSVPATAGKESPARMSVSAVGPLTPSATRFAVEPTDREPIRVVENPTAATRTASAAARQSTTTPTAKFVAPSTATAK